VNEGEFNCGELSSRICPRRPVTILCADDLPALRACYAKVLARTGYDITVVADGQEALETLGSGRFDLVITDMEMPRLDGRGLVLRMRTTGMSHPIIVAASDPEFFDYPDNQWLQVMVLRKPFLIGELTETVKLLLQVPGHHGAGHVKAGK
jgi:CheY-like chemotaxis protein